ncbi:MAG: tetraacyldisaccharide 4'-kinase [Pseudomonadota bacterium]
MPVETPAWWYPEGNGTGIQRVIAQMLRPFGSLYSGVTAHRMARNADYSPSIPVICIGNFTAGGTGKTPLALALAEMLQASGHRVAFLSRGYGGKTFGPYDVDIARDTADRVGDEPLLLARQAPTTIARDRTAGAKQIERTGADVIIMDDGLQNPTLSKSLTFAVIDGARGLGNGLSIPAGPLRATLEDQLAHVDAIVINGQPATTLPPLGSKVVLHGEIAATADALALADLPLLAFAGIGNPDRFAETLGQLSTNIQDLRTFPDHYPYSDADAERLLEAARHSASQLVTTRKDWVRLTGAPRESARARLQAAALPIDVAFRFANNDAQKLTAMFELALTSERNI